MPRATVRLDKRKLEQLARETNGKVDDLVASVALLCVAEIVDNFSNQSPSDPGTPPGVDTGTLKNAVNAQPVRKMVWAVRDGVDYGIHLEYGTMFMAARPFFLPAVMRTAKRMRDEGLLKKVIEG